MAGSGAKSPVALLLPGLQGVLPGKALVLRPVALRLPGLQNL